MHPYLNLNLGETFRYAMVVNNSEIGIWQSKGWLTYDAIGLPEDARKNYLMYGQINVNETLMFNRPILLKEIDIKELIGLTVKDYSLLLGTYGMGGPRYFGLLLSNNKYLTYAVWGAGHYIMIDNIMVEMTLDQYEYSRPWISNFGAELS